MVRFSLKAVLTSLAVGVLALCTPHSAQAQLADLSASAYNVPHGTAITFTITGIPSSYTHPVIVCEAASTGTVVGTLTYEGGEWVASGSGQPVNTGGHGSASFIWTSQTGDYQIQCIGGPPLQNVTNSVYIVVY